MTDRGKVNRKNALRSTGPRTQEGKAIVAWNALKHGLLSRETVLYTESRTAFRALAASLLEHLQPVGVLECLLVDRIVANTWRLRRVHVVESDLLSDATLATPGERYCAVSDLLPNLSRYEAAIDRSLFRALHELERLQLRRSGAAVAPPVAMDIDVAIRNGSEEPKNGS